MKNLQQILTKWGNSDLIQKQQNLLCIIQFGSSVKVPLKKRTDIDLLFIFDQLPAQRSDQYKILDLLEEPLEKELKELKNYDLSISSLIKSKDSLKKLSPIFLDMTTLSELLYDPHLVGQTLLEQVKGWMKRHGSKRVQKGLKWYWILDTTSDDPKAPVDLTLDID